MKIKSCYLENFGCFSQKTFNFDGELTVVNEQNGYGKSTLCAFIKAMFYGLDGYRENYNKDGELPERLHYYPFSGGEFGGNLTFELDGNEYKIERFFTPKSEVGDTLKVYLNGEITNVFGDDVGKVIFGIDKQSFERISLISSDEIKIESTSSINAKLSEFLNGADFDVSLDDAVSKLDTTSKVYKKSRKADDKISLKESEIAFLTEKIFNLKNVYSAISEKTDRLNAKKSEIEVLSKEVSSAQLMNGKIKDYERYEELLNLSYSSKQKTEELLSKYNGVMPKMEEIQAVSELLSKERELNALKDGGLSEDERLSYENLSVIFSAGVPTLKDVERVESSIENLSSLTAKEKLVEQAEQSQREIELDNKFLNNTPSNALISDANGLYSDYRRLKNELEDLSRARDNLSIKKKTPFKLYLSLAVLFLLGVGLIFINLIAGIAVSLVSVLLLIGVLIYYSKTQGGEVVNFDASVLRSKISDIENKLGYILSMYGYSLSDGLTYAFTAFIRDHNDYLTVLNSRRERAENKNKIALEIYAIKASLNGYFSAFKIQSTNYLNALSELKNKISLYFAFGKRLEDLEKAKNEISLKLNEIENSKIEFKNKYKVASIDLSDVISDVNEFNLEFTRFNELQRKAKNFKEEKGIKEKPAWVAVDIDVLNEKLSELQQEYALLSSEIESDEYAVEKLDGYLAEKAIAEQSLRKYKKNYELLIATKTLLLKAEQNLKDKYVSPIKDEFIKYSSVIEKTLGEKVSMSKNFEITFERNGKERSEKHLSSGVKSICALCFRLALIKNMYKDKAPFIILDDPFVFLDGEHFEKVKQVVYSLSKDMQILYFTCHDARKI